MRRSADRASRTPSRPESMIAANVPRDARSPRADRRARPRSSTAPRPSTPRAASSRRELDHRRDRPAPQIRARLLVPQPVDERRLHLRRRRLRAASPSAASTGGRCRRRRARRSASRPRERRARAPRARRRRRARRAGAPGSQGPGRRGSCPRRTSPRLPWPLVPLEAGILGGRERLSEPVPGVVVVWTGAQPTVQVFRVPAAGLVIGRELLQSTTDDRISRQHARIMWKDKRFVVTDLGSRNGTYAGGHALIDREVTVTPPSVVRTGRTVCVLLEDVRRFEGASIETRHDAIVGASTHPLWLQAEKAAEAGVEPRSSSASPASARAGWRAATRACATSPRPCSTRRSRRCRSSAIAGPHDRDARSSSRSASSAPRTRRRSSSCSTRGRTCASSRPR